MPPATAHSGIQVRAVDVRFGGLHAISALDLDVMEGEILGLIGPNGAGKTTLVNVMSGFQRPDSGSVTLGGVSMGHWPPRRFARAGIARTFQNVRLFRDMSVRENVEVGAISVGQSRAEARASADALLDWLGLSASAGMRCSALAYGDERRVGIARALSMRPRFVLLDEPAAGMNEAECAELMTTIARIPEQFGCGVLLIEHNMRVVMGVCDRIQVIASGASIAVGAPAEIQRNRAVIDAYLGEKRKV